MLSQSILITIIIKSEKLDLIKH